MITNRYIAALVGLLITAKEPPKRDERGLSQSAEVAILIAGAVAIAIVVVSLITNFVTKQISDI